MGVEEIEVQEENLEHKVKLVPQEEMVNGEHQVSTEKTVLLVNAVPKVHKESQVPLV